MKKTNIANAVTIAIAMHRQAATQLDIDKCVAATQQYTQDCPTIPTDSTTISLAQAENLVQQVGDFLHALKTKQLSLGLSIAESFVVADMINERLTAMHIAVQSLLYDLGVVKDVGAKISERRRTD